MTPSVFLTQVLDPGLAFLKATLGDKPPGGDNVRVWLLATAAQESDLEYVEQLGGGPGRGYWQFETETVSEILTNSASAAMAAKICAAMHLLPTTQAIYQHLLVDPNLMVAFARLDLWCDPFPLPPLGDALAGWETYLRVWRPGKPRQDDWAMNYAAAMQAINLKDQHL